MGLAPICIAYSFYSTMVEGDNQLNLLNKILKKELEIYAKQCNLSKDSLIFSISADYEPKYNLNKDDLKYTYYKKIKITNFSNNEVKLDNSIDILENIFHKLLTLKLINCYCLRDIVKRKKRFPFFKDFSSKLVATESYAKLYMLAMYRLLDPLSPYWPECILNIKDDNKIQTYTAKEMDKLLKSAQKDPQFELLFINNN